jgi:hypothetical protein
MYCLESKRLVASHLNAIGEWKRIVKTNFQGEDHPEARRAWKKALEAESSLCAHFEEHGCNAAPAFSDRAARGVQLGPTRTGLR